MKRPGGDVKPVDDPLVGAVRLVGRPWTLLIVSVLTDRPRRFGEIVDALPGISTNLLTERLRDLQAASVVDRTTRNGLAVYDLAPRGRSLLPVVDALRTWASH